MMAKKRALLPLSLRRFARREDGVAIVENILVLPTLLFLFFASVESGFYMIKQVMFERGLDLTMRDLRIGRLGTTISQNDLRTAICDRTRFLPNCRTELRIWTTPVRANVIPTMPHSCGNGGDPDLTPVVGDSSDTGSSNEVVFVRVCVLERPIFPGTGIGLRMRGDSSGNYEMVASTIIVNEPTQ